jgi:hypothetical protein
MLENPGDEFFDGCRADDLASADCNQEASCEVFAVGVGGCGWRVGEVGGAAISLPLIIIAKIPVPFRFSINFFAN